jgi:hypothetical protein
MVRMLHPGQQVRVNLAGMQVGSATFHAAVTDAVGTIVRQVSEDPPFLFSRCGRSGSAGDSDRREVRAPHPQEAPCDQRTAHLGNCPRGCGRGFGCPHRCASFQIRWGLEDMPEDCDSRSDAGTLHAA